MDTVDEIAKDVRVLWVSVLLAAVTVSTLLCNVRVEDAG